MSSISLESSVALGSSGTLCTGTEDDQLKQLQSEA